MILQKKPIGLLQWRMAKLFHSLNTLYKKSGKYITYLKSCITLSHYILF